MLISPLQLTNKGHGPNLNPSASRLGIKVNNCDCAEIWTCASPNMMAKPRSLVNINTWTLVPHLSRPSWSHIRTPSDTWRVRLAEFRRHNHLNKCCVVGIRIQLTIIHKFRRTNNVPENIELTLDQKIRTGNSNHASRPAQVKNVHRIVF